MGEMDNDWLQFFYDGKPIRQGDFGCGLITKPSAKTYTQVDTTSDAKFLTPPNCDALKQVVDEMKEKILADLSIKPHTARKHYTPKFTL